MCGSKARRVATGTRLPASKAKRPTALVPAFRRSCAAAFSSTPRRMSGYGLIAARSGARPAPACGRSGSGAGAAPHGRALLVARNLAPLGAREPLRVHIARPAARLVDDDDGTLPACEL